jgi:hypothetical protein
MGDGLGVIGIHMLDHALLAGVGKRVGESDVIQPMDGAEAAYVAVADRRQHPEIKIMGPMIILRLGEEPIVTRGGCLYGSTLLKPMGFGEHREAPDGLHILRPALTDQQRTFGVHQQVVGVLRDAAHQDQWLAVGIQAIGHHGAERETRHRLGMGRQHAAVLRE